MDKQIAQGIFERLDALADKLGTTVDHLWPVLVAKQQVLGWIGVGIWVFWVIMLVVIAYFAVTKFNMIETGEDLSKKEKYIRDFCGYTFWSSIFFLAVMVIVGCVYIGNTAIRIFCPEAAALTEILNLIR